MTRRKIIGQPWPNGFAAKFHTLYHASETDQEKPGARGRVRYWHLWDGVSDGLGGVVKSWTLLRFTTHKKYNKAGFYARYFYRLKGDETEEEVKQMAETLMTLINIGETT